MTTKKRLQFKIAQSECGCFICFQFCQLKSSSMARIPFSTTASLALLTSVCGLAPTFCPLLSPTNEIVYIRDSPSVSTTAQTMLLCATMCAHSALSGGATCRCFNYNSTSLSCGIFTTEPKNIVVDSRHQMVAYQVIQNKNPITLLYR